MKLPRAEFVRRESVLSAHAARSTGTRLKVAHSFFDVVFEARQGHDWHLSLRPPRPEMALSDGSVVFFDRVH